MRMLGGSVLSEIRLPWPDKDMSPNARIHWARKAKAVKIARCFAFFKTKEAGWDKIQLPEGRLHLWIDFYPPTKRMPDDDNMLSRCKAYRDGIADALGIDDKRFISPNRQKIADVPQVMTAEHSTEVR